MLLKVIRRLNSPVGLLILAVVFVAVLLLAVAGFSEQAAAAGQHPSLDSLLGHSLLLFRVSYEPYGQRMPPALVAARVLAPLVLAGPTMLVSWVVLAQANFLLFLLQFARGHVVVCGLG